MNHNMKNGNKNGNSIKRNERMKRSKMRLLRSLYLILLILIVNGKKVALSEVVYNKVVVRVLENRI